MSAVSKPTIVERLASLAVDRGAAVLIEEWTVDGELVSEFTASEVWDRAVALGSVLRTLVPSGSAVALVVSPSAGAVIAQCAVAYAGCTFVPLNPAAPAPELEREMRTAGCCLAIVGGDLDTSRREVLELCTTRAVVRVDGPSLAVPVDGAAMPVDPAAIVFTSGSTAAPRGAVFTHAALANASDESVGLFHLEAADRLLCNLPLHHVAGNVSLVWPALTTGATLVIVPFSAGRFFELVAATRVTFGIINATHIRMIEAKGAVPVSHSLRRAATGFSLSADRLRSVEERFGVEMLNGYGFTEALGHVTSQRLDRARTPGGAGWPIGGRRVTIVAEDGTPMPAGTIGEISVTWSTPHELMTSYVGDPDATQALIGDGAIRTGDLGYLTGDGELFFADRIKDIMKRGGITVSPAEIEAVVALHPGVEECAVIAMPSDVYGEEPVAVVVAARGGDSGSLPDEVLQLCAAHLDRHKVPASVMLVTELPRLTIGKVDKRALRDAMVRAAGASDEVTDQGG